MQDTTLQQRIEKATREIKALRIAMDRLGIIAKFGEGSKYGDSEAKLLGDWARDALNEMLLALNEENWQAVPDDAESRREQREDSFLPREGQPRHLEAVAEMNAQVAADQAFDAQCRARDEAPPHIQAAAELDALRKARVKR